MSRDRTKRLMNGGLSETQIEVVKFVKEWCFKKNRPCPRNEIFLAVMQKKHSEGSIRAAITELTNDGYFRKAESRSRNTFYVIQKWI
jgi:sulfur relay (sulfurtransferase) DsrC/TusE family protein